MPIAEHEVVKWLSQYMFDHPASHLSPSLIIVLGTSRPHRPADHAIQLYKKYHCPLILSGGYNQHLGACEADLMAQRLIQSGVPQEQFVIERQARYTHENFELSLPWIKSFRLSENQINIGIVAINYHMKRALISAQKVAPYYAWQAYPYNSIYCPTDTWQQSQPGKQLIIQELQKLITYHPELTKTWPISLLDLKIWIDNHNHRRSVL